MGDGFAAQGLYAEQQEEKQQEVPTGNEECLECLKHGKHRTRNECRALLPLGRVAAVGRW